MEPVQPHVLVERNTNATDGASDHKKARAQGRIQDVGRSEVRKVKLESTGPIVAPSAHNKREIEAAHTLLDLERRARVDAANDRKTHKDAGGSSAGNTSFRSSSSRIPLKAVTDGSKLGPEPGRNGGGGGSDGAPNVPSDAQRSSSPEVRLVANSRSKGQAAPKKGGRPLVLPHASAHFPHRPVHAMPARTRTPLASSLPRAQPTLASGSRLTGASNPPTRPPQAISNVPLPRPPLKDKLRVVDPPSPPAKLWLPRSPKARQAPPILADAPHTGRVRRRDREDGEISEDREDGEISDDELESGEL